MQRRGHLVPGHEPGLCSIIAAVPYGFVILVVASTMGAFAYSQTDNWHTAMQWSVSCIVEAIIVTVSVIGLRWMGYVLSTCPDRD